MNERIEFVSEFYHNYVMKFNTAFIFLPAILITVINYFILDLGQDQSYFLPMPILCVKYIHTIEQ